MMDELEAMEEETTRSEKPRSGGAFNRVTAFLLGILMGIILVVGGVAGAGYYVYSQPVRSTVNLVDPSGKIFNTLFNEENGYLNEKYADMKVGELIGDVISAASALGGDGSLSDVDELSPFVGDKVDGLLKQTSKYGILKAEYEDTEGTGKKQELMNTPLSEMGDYLMQRVKETTVADMLKGSNDGKEITDVLTLAICYGELNEGYTKDEEGNIVPLTAPTTLLDLTSDGGMTDIINKLSFETVLTATGEEPWKDPMKAVIAYGPESHYTLVKDGEDNVTGVEMNQIVYTVVEGVLCDDKGEPVPDCTYDGSAQTVTFTNGDPTQYLKSEGGVLKAYHKNEAGEETPALYAKTKVNDLSGDMLTLVEDVYLKDVLLKGQNSTHRILLSICYGSDGYTVDEHDNVTVLPTAVFRTIGDLKNNNEGLINEVPLSDLMEDDGSDLMRYLLYGKKDVHYSVVGGKVEMNRQRIVVVGTQAYNGYGEAITGTVNLPNSFTAGEVTYSLENASLTQTFKVKKTVGEDTIVETLTGDVYYLSATDGTKLYYEKTSIGALTGSDNVISNMTTRITVGEIMNAEDMEKNMFLKHVTDETIDTLPYAIENLTITKVYEKDIYKMNTEGTHFIDKFGNNILSEDDYDQRVVNSEWWYLLHDEAVCSATHGTCDKSCIEDYKVKELGKLITNMRTNIEHASLFQLKSDGMVNGLDNDTLNADIKTEIGGANFYTPPTGKTKLGDLTVVELLDYVNVIFSHI